MSDNQLIAQVNSNLTLLIAVMLVVFVLGVALVLLDKNRTHKTQLEYAYSALPPQWQGLVRFLVLKGKEASDYLDNITDGVIGNETATTGTNDAKLQQDVLRP